MRSLDEVDRAARALEDRIGRIDTALVRLLERIDAATGATLGEFWNPTEEDAVDTSIFLLTSGARIGATIQAQKFTEDVIVTSGGLYVGSDSDPPTDELHVDGDIKTAAGISVGSLANNPGGGDVWATVDMRVGGGLYIGSLAQDPPYGELRVKGDIKTSAAGGISVGTHGNNPGGGELWTTAGVRIGTGLYVGGLGTVPTNDEVRADGDIKTAAGISVGSLANNPDAGHFWATGNGRIGGGLTIGSITQDPPADEIWIQGSANLVRLFANADNGLMVRPTVNPGVGGFLFKVVNSAGVLDLGIRYNQYAEFAHDVRIDNGLYVGGVGTDPPDNEIHADGDIKTAGGLSSGNLANNPDAGDVWATADGRFGGGVYVGGVGVNPPTGELYTTADVRIGAGLYVGSIGTDPPVDQIHADGDIRTAGGISAGSLANDPANGEIWSTADMRVGGGLWVGRITGDPPVDRIVVDMSMKIGSVGSFGLSNFMTSGITIHQGTNDDEILAMQSTDIVHGLTTVADTSTFWCLAKHNAVTGGAAMRGLSEATVGISNWGYGITPVTTKTTSSNAFVEVVGVQGSGAGITDSSADANIFGVWTRRGGSYNSIVLIDEDGDIYYDGALNNYDNYDDALMAKDLAHVVSGQYNQVIEHNRERFEEMGIIGPQDENGHFMMSTKKVNALVLGALGQLWQRCEMQERLLQSIVGNQKESGYGPG